MEQRLTPNLTMFVAAIVAIFTIKDRDVNAAQAPTPAFEEQWEELVTAAAD